MPKHRDAEHMIALGHRIRSRRQWQRLSAAELGSRVAVSQQQVARYELGAGDPPARLLVNIAKALDTTPNELLGVPDGDHVNEATALLADPLVAAILQRLRDLPPAARVVAASLVRMIPAGAPDAN